MCAQPEAAGKAQPDHRDDRRAEDPKNVAHGRVGTTHFVAYDQGRLRRQRRDQGANAFGAVLRRFVLVVLPQFDPAAIGACDGGWLRAKLTGQRSAARTP